MTENIPTYPDLRGKVAVVTGGSGGIGAATCRLLAANGAKVAVNGRDEAKIDAVVGEIRSAGGEAVGAPADCTDLAAVEGMRRRTEEELGPVGIVAAFVGGGRARPDGRARSVRGRQGGGGDAHPTRREGGRAPRRAGQLPGPAHRARRTHPPGDSGGAAAADG